MVKGIAGKTAVLTGAARLSGLGHAFSLGLAEAGARIVIADIVDGSEAAAKIKEAGGHAVFVPCDVSKRDEVAALHDLVDKDHGGCDILVHCASPLYNNNIEDIEYDEWRSVLSVNLEGMYLLARAFVPGMKLRRWGRIIPISSTTFHAGIGGRTHYVAAKAGLIGFTRSLAREVGDYGITVNALAPGLVRTDGSVASLVDDAVFGEADPYSIIRDQQCIRQALVPENMVGPLLFLASDAAAFVTGQTLLVDAGWQHV